MKNVVYGMSAKCYAKKEEVFSMNDQAFDQGQTTNVQVNVLTI